MMPKFLLLVTHDPAIAQLNFMEFYEAGFVLYSAGSLREATTLLRQRPIDLLLVDLQPQAREAIQFCQEAKAANSRLKAGFLAAQDQPLPADPADFLVMREQFRGNALQELKSALGRMSGAPG
jgi:CheY-like chemotaxis protein